MHSFAAVVLAAGQGTRMKSELPKVLHPLMGKPMLAWVADAALEAGAERVVVVVGHGRERVIAELASRYAGAPVTTAVQDEQRGTGHAARSALPALEGFAGDVAILNGDIPLLEPEAIRALLESRSTRPMALLTCDIDDPTGYGRILRDASGAVIGIREHRDCSPEELQISEMNPGVYAAEVGFLREALASLVPDNAQGELYLTDIVARASGRGGAAGHKWPIESLHGINDRAQLADVAKTLQRRINVAHARRGVTIRDLGSAYIEAGVTIEPDAIIEPQVTLRGATSVGARARLDVGCVLDGVRVAAGAYLKPYSVATQSSIGEDAQIGPFAHLRPGTELDREVHVGNFVETKKTTMGKGSKANHLSYLGDGVIEANVNVGAGTIFCNYDGVQKHTTVLEEGSFIGSDSQLVAPIRVGKGAYVATGTTVTRDVPADALAVGRTKQENKEGYAPRLKARMRAAAEAAKKK